MKTVIDLVNFLTNLKSNYPIPYVDKIVSKFEDVEDVYDYSLSWETEKGYVEVSISSNGHVSIYFGNGIYRKHEELNDEVYAEIKTCLNELYENWV